MVKRPGFFMFLIALFIFIFVSSAGFLSFSSKAHETDNLIRFHVVANSNSNVDQDVKYKVRDALVALLSEDLAELKNYNEACDLIIEKEAEIIDEAYEVLAASGLSYPVNVEFGKYLFPLRAYGKIILPPGEYQAVKVVLGNGEGANWWCVLFPPLCFVDVSGEDKEAAGISKPIMAEKNSEDVDIGMRFWQILRVPGEHMARILNI